MLLNDEWKQLLRDYREYHNKPLCELTHVIGIPMLAASFPVTAVNPPLGLSMMATGVALQILGHKIQGNKPQLLHDRRFMAVGAIWWFDTVLRPIGLGEKIFGVDPPGAAEL